MLAQITFWIAVFLPLYAYAGYPLLLLALRLVIRRDVRKQPITPSVSLLIPAHNEADVIARKIDNSLALDYPPDRIEIIVASDGSRDDTVAAARARADGTRVRVLAFEQNRGKVATLNESMAELRGEIVVFSDAPAMLLRDSVRKLVESFADPEVGAVSGLYKVVKADEVNIGSSEDFYWRYETFLKVKESQLASTLGGHGHLHAIRKDLYPFPDPETINDDYVIPVSVLAKGYRAVYEPCAIVYEEAREMTGFGRRIRIMTGNIQQLREIGGLLHPFRPLPLFFFLSHKFARLLVPFAMLTALAANLLLLDSPFYRAIFFGQLLFYALAAAGAIVRLRPRPLMLPYYFSMINAATFFGVYHALTARRRMAWK
ncbi:MAG TPA: glycosyltransferase family 2 protein [Bryobacteraceae bacterium]|nr:glycosyltransferase family 2 protein [Bryobacteraceae bacterium]